MRYAWCEPPVPAIPALPDFIKSWVNYGASLRASQFLILGGKARAVLQGRYNVSVDDIRDLAPPVLPPPHPYHFHAESEQVNSDVVIRKLLEAIPAPASACNPHFSPGGCTLLKSATWRRIFRFSACS